MQFFVDEDDCKPHCLNGIDQVPAKGIEPLLIPKTGI